MGPAIRLMVKIPPRTTLRVIEGLGFCRCAWRAIHVPTRDQTQGNVAKPQAHPEDLQKGSLSPMEENASGSSAGPSAIAQQNNRPYIKASNA